MVSLELVIAAFFGLALIASIASRRTKTPYTIMLVLSGLVLALLAASVPDLASSGGFFQTFLSDGLFVGLVLPPLLFESMMSISTEEFRAVYRSSLLLATGGVVFAAAVVGTMLWLFAGLPAYTSYLFAALIAPTDVATVLEVFRRTKVPARLSTLMETEAVFNDATGISLFTIILASGQAAAAAGSTRFFLLSAASQFVQLFGIGLVTGAFVAWGARQLQREIDDTVSQVILTMAAVFGSYALASALGGSPLIAVAVTGLFYGNTVLFRIKNKEVESGTRQFWQVLAFIANTIAFLFIGLSANIVTFGADIFIILFAFLIVIAGRFVSVYTLLGVRRVAWKRFPFSWRNVTVLGGMRGALSIVLVAALPTDLAGRDVVVEMTFGIAVLSILLQGPLLGAYVKRAFGRQEKLPETSEAPAPSG
jgi:Na+:H+ antiporter